MHVHAKLCNEQLMTEKEKTWILAPAWLSRAVSTKITNLLQKLENANIKIVMMRCKLSIFTIKNIVLVLINKNLNVLSPYDRLEFILKPLPKFLITEKLYVFLYKTAYPSCALVSAVSLYSRAPDFIPLTCL